MKRLICLLLTLLALTGCGGHGRETEPNGSKAPTEPPGSFQPGSELEDFTGGAVRNYRISVPDAYAIAAAGEDLLIFSGAGNTRITRLTGENLFRVAEITLHTKIRPEMPGVLISEDRLVYFDESSNTIVRLDETFRETCRIALPEDRLGNPVISADEKSVYYCTADGVRVLDTETGISRLLKEISNPEQSVGGLLLDDTVMKLCHPQENGLTVTQFLDAATGRLLEETEGLTAVSSGSGLCWACRMEGERVSVLLGKPGEPVRELIPGLPGGEITLLNGAAVVCTGREDGWQLDCYDLESGLRRAGVTLPEDGKPLQYALDPEGRYLYYISLGEAEGYNLCRWDLDICRTGDEKDYTSIWYTADAPDREGLTACQARADALSQRSGLDIRLYADAVETVPENVTVTTAYRVPELTEALQSLEEVLALLPENLIGDAGAHLKEGCIHLCLVDTLEGGCDAGGTCFRQDGDVYILLAQGEDLPERCLHQLFHVMETRILSNSVAYYRWDELPDSASEEPHKEERARIFAAACMAGREDFFASAPMQKKLKTLCTGIREGFDPEKSGEYYPWEQYLQ